MLLRGAAVPRMDGIEQLLHTVRAVRTDTTLPTPENNKGLDELAQVASWPSALPTT